MLGNNDRGRPIISATGIPSAPLRVTGLRAHRRKGTFGQVRENRGDEFSIRDLKSIDLRVRAPAVGGKTFGGSNSSGAKAAPGSDAEFSTVSRTSAAARFGDQVQSVLLVFVARGTGSHVPILAALRTSISRYGSATHSKTSRAVASSKSFSAPSKFGLAMLWTAVNHR